MIQIVAFTSETNINILDAIAAAILAFPNVNFSSIRTNEDLANMLQTMQQTLYVNVDTNIPVQDALNAAATLKSSIDASMTTINCPIPPLIITQADVDSLDLCAIPPDFPPDIDYTKINSDLLDLETVLSNNGVSAQSDIDAALSCVSIMNDITTAINALNIKASNINTTLINLEELLYNYRIMEAYFRKRILTINQLIGTFDPLITLKDTYQTQVNTLTPLDKQAKALYDTASAALASQTGQLGVSGYSGSSSTASNSANNSNGSTNIETPQHVSQLLASYNSIHAQLLNATTELQNVMNDISFQESSISPILQEINFEQSTSYLQLGVQEQQAAQLTWLEDNIKNLFNGGTDVFQNVPLFSSRLKITANPGSSVTNQSFLLSIEYKLIDDSNILAGRPKPYATTAQNVTITTPESNVIPTGTLYTQLYNIWGNIDLFFTPEERGLTSNSNMVAPSLIGTRASTIGSNYIANLGTFQDFYQNFPTNQINKTIFVKSTIIEPAISTITSGLENLAIKEVQYLFAYGKAFETLPTQSTQLTGIVNSIITSSNVYLANISQLRADYAFAQKAYTDVQAEIETQKQKYYNVPCASTAPNPPESNPPVPGSDPLGANSIQQQSPADPDPTKFCYWVKFAENATAVNILPIPGDDGLKYWPIGLQIPTPSGIVNIPLPIIWIPIAVIVLPVGMFVIFIGQCGLCPSPVVFFIGSSGEKKFIISLRSTEDFGSNASSDVIKTLDDNGIAEKILITTALNNSASIPNFTPIIDPDSSSNIIADIKDKIFKSANKLGIPDISNFISALNNTINPADQKAAFQSMLNTHLSGLTLPDWILPKNGSKTNPKALPTIEVLNDLKKLLKMDLPQIAIPSISTIDLIGLLIAQVGNIDTTTIQNINIPPINNNTETPSNINTYYTTIRNALKTFISILLTKINPTTLGMLSVALPSGVSFINPYKCKPNTTGIAVPPIPGIIVSSVGEVQVIVNSFIDNLSITTIQTLISGINGNITPSVLPDVITNILQQIPAYPIPNPSNLSILNMQESSVLSLVKAQLPSLPDLSEPIQIQVTIPGMAISTTLISAIEQTINSIQLSDINIDFSNPNRLNGTDVKQAIIGIIEVSLKPITNFVQPLISLVSSYQNTINQKFSETIGLKKITTDNTTISVITPQAIDEALIVLKGLSLVPYPAVLSLPSVFKNLHPILASDDLPPWNRLSLDNFLFVIFLDEFCSTGKKGCGFQENP